MSLNPFTAHYCSLCSNRPMPRRVSGYRAVWQCEHNYFETRLTPAQSRILNDPANHFCQDCGVPIEHGARCHICGLITLNTKYLVAN
jgi:hypothetical protein